MARVNLVPRLPSSSRLTCPAVALALATRRIIFRLVFCECNAIADMEMGSPAHILGD